MKIPHDIKMITSVMIRTNNNNVISSNIINPFHMPLESEWVKKVLNQFDVVAMSYKNYKLLKLSTITYIPSFYKIIIIDDELKYICKDTIIVKSVFDIHGLIRKNQRLLLICDNEKIKVKDVITISYIVIIIHDTMKPDPLGERFTSPGYECIHCSHMDDENSESFVVKILRQYE